MEPAPGGTAMVPVKVTLCPALIATRSEPPAVSRTTGWMPCRAAASAGRITLPLWMR